MLWATVKAPPNPIGAYINVEAIARPTSALPEFDRLQIGRLPVPGSIADWLLARALDRLNETEAGKTAWERLTSLAVTCQQRCHDFVSWLTACLPLDAPVTSVPPAR